MIRAVRCKAAAFVALFGKRACSTGGNLVARKDVLYSLGNVSDPEASAAIRAFQRQQFLATAEGAMSRAAEESGLTLAAQIEKKYMAAQHVESGSQNLAVPLSWTLDGGVAALKRYVAQLQAIGAEAGFAAPVAGLQVKLGTLAGGVDSARELLARLKPFTSSEYHSALSQTLQTVEADVGTPITLDGSSIGYKQFTDKVKALAQAHKLPWHLLLPAHEKVNVDEDSADNLRKEHARWLQSAAVEDAKAELADLKAEVQRMLDLQLNKSTEALSREQQASLAAVARRLEAAKGTAWAATYKLDSEFTSWFDAVVARSPTQGPTAATA